jgi:diadenylate cyclase
MSRTRTGALIVMERSTKLGDIIRSGVELDAKVTAYLIRNVFYNKAPLHDGAMIIRNGRICAASCFLPLTERAINQDLGTRHRAALGMSEISDALIIVVSEETGTISIAYDGELKRNQNYQTLKQTLTELCVRK